MKTPVYFGLLLSTLLLAGPLHGQRKPRIKGNRDVVTVERELPAFAHLVLADDLEVRLQPAEAEGIRIEADDNLVDILRFEADGDTLRISSFYNITSRKALELTLKYRNLESIRIVAGRLHADQPLQAGELAIHLQERGRASLEVEAALVSLLMEDHASASLRLEGDSLNLALGGQTDTEIRATADAIALSLTGHASLSLEGTGETVEAALKEQTSLKASGLQGQEVTVRLSDSAHARVTAVRLLAYEGEGDARLFVYGEPEIRILGFRDRAELHKAAE